VDAGARPRRSCATCQATRRATKEWLSELELPLEERETVDAALRQVAFLDAEIAAVGDVGRFPDRRKLTGYLGLDPRVRQSGVGPASHGRISKQGSSRARHALVEASWSTVRQPGPIAGFYSRIKARRGHQVAIVAAARKLACLFWCLLTREEDYAFAQPSLTKKKMRRLELAAGSPRYQGGRSVWSTNEAMRTAERELALQAQRAYERTVKDWQQKRGAGAKAPDLHLDTSSPAPTRTVSHQIGADNTNDLTFIRRPKRERLRHDAKGKSVRRLVAAWLAFALHDVLDVAVVDARTPARQ
jgi:hypothetical protein